MDKSVKLLTSFMVMNGWATDEVQVMQRFIKHSLPHSLRCISDVLDSFGIKHQISLINCCSQISITKDIALFIPSRHQPLIVSDHTGNRIIDSIGEADVFEIKITKGPNKRRHIDSLIRHLIWGIDNKIIASAVITCVSLGVLFCALIGHFSINSFALCLLLLIGWILSGIAVYKGLFHDPALKGLCNIAGKDTCLEIIHSEESRLFGIVPLGLLSLVYYSFILFMFVISHEDVTINAIIGYASLLAIPIIVYSIFWQFKNKRYCSICLGIDLTLISQVIISFRYIVPFPLRVLLAGIAVPVSLIMIACILSIILWERHQIQTISRDKLRFKHESVLSRPEIFRFLIEREPLLVQNELDFSLKNNNKEFEHHLIAVLNPYCTHCKDFVLTLDNLSNCKLEIIWASPSKKSFILSSWLIHIYRQIEIDAFRIAVSKWKDGEQPPNGWIPEKEIAHLATLHNTFVVEHGISVTPFIIIDGKGLPDVYDYNDLIYLLG